MTENEWTELPDGESPYVHAWWNNDYKLRVNSRDFVPRGDALLLNPQRFSNEQTVLRGGGLDWQQVGPVQGNQMAKSLFGNGDRVPLPKGTRNPKWADNKDHWITDEVVNRLPNDVHPNTVIVAVIDTGIALGHRAFRRANGTSRVISAWQQTAEFRHQSQDYLPFGEEWFAGDIDGALRDFSRNRDPMDRLDEEAFNRALRLVEPERIRGHRDLDHRAAHGTHVMDIASGFERGRGRADRVRMIVVNLPTQYLHGSAGNFLWYFAAYALERVFAVADALWKKNRPGEHGGYPLAINFAYGMMAGPKDGTAPIEKIMDVLMAQRQSLPTSLCMPSGNENLARAVAKAELKADTFTDPIPWRLLPSDRTSNFVEFWFNSGGGTPCADLDKYRFEISAPNGWTGVVGGAKDRHFFELPQIGARLYCTVHWVGGTAQRVCFLLAAAPTLILEQADDLAAAPAGLWKIRVASPLDGSVYCFVQSDQSATTHSKAGLRSYFDHEDYRTHLPNGRVCDSYSYTPGADPELQEDPDAMVTRRWSQNAIATTTSASSIGGYRRSDGRPAPYSATGVRLFPSIVGTIQAAYPTDDAPAYYGVLAAGARDGSSVAFRGTSMAAAQATRRAAEAMLDELDAGTSAPGTGGINWHEAEACAAETLSRPGYNKAASEKVGAGRVGLQADHRAERPGRLRRG